MMSGDEVRLDQTFQPECPVGEPLLTVSHLSGHRFDDVSFTLKRGEILGFAGLIGAGRTELMQGMFGYTRPSGGSVVLDGTPLHLGSPAAAVGAGMLYLSEDRQLHGILPALSVRENIGISILDQICHAGVVSATAETKAVAEVIDAYDIKTASPEKKIMFLSGGNQQKTIIGRAMARRPRVLIFDEPTRGIDVRNKVEIYKIMKKLAEEGVGIILISSEIAELKRCATRILTMHYGSLTGEFDARTTDANRLVGAMIGTTLDPTAATTAAPGGNTHVA
jgi:ribose transport system ATP-binding protein